MSIRYDENTKARAVRLVREHREDYDSEWAAMKAISGRLGMNPETLRKWVRQAEIDAGEAAGVSSEERRELRELRRKNPRAGTNDRNTKGRNKFLRAGVRPATPLICAFIDAHREQFGVVPICRALAVHGVQIAPRTYWAHRSAAPSKRALWDTTITEILAGYYEPDADGKRPPESLYGSLKMWAHLQREGIPVARRTVERIMRRNGWRGVVRARRTPRTTEPDPAAARAPDLVGRRWRVARTEPAGGGRLQLRADDLRVRLHRVCRRRLRGTDRRVGMLTDQRHRLRRACAAPRRGLPRPPRPPVRRHHPSQ